MVADETDTDRVVMSTYALTGPARTVLGSVAEAAVRTQERPVLLVRRTGGALDGRLDDSREPAVECFTSRSYTVPTRGGFVLDGSNSPIGQAAGKARQPSVTPSPIRDWVEAAS